MDAACRQNPKNAFFMPPNILIFMTDQQRGATVRPDHPAKTPVIDRFGADAVRFEEAHAPSPHCCPSRTSFFTGLYPSGHGVWNNVCVRNALSTGPRPGVRLWSEDLAAAGYRLDFNGKWHVDRRRGPEDFGFRVGSITAGARKHGQGWMGADWSDYEAGYARMDDAPRRPGEIRREGWGSYVHYGEDEDPFGDAAHVEDACRAIADRPAEKPWCHFIGPLGPHDPYKAPRRFLDLYDPAGIELPDSFGDRMEDKPGLYRRTRARFDRLPEQEHREALRHYYALCSYEDHLFGRVLEALEASGQADDTIVVYCSDHGDYCADHGLWCKGLPCFRGAYEIPFLVRWPGVTDRAAHSETAYVSLVDFAPTVREWAGAASEAPCAGRSLVPLLREGAEPEPPDAWFTQSNGNELYGIQRSVATRDWKLVYNGFDEDELYDLRNDPGETVNRARDPGLREVRRELYRRLWSFAHEQGDDAINDYIATGLAEFGPGIAFDGRPNGVG